MNIEHELLVKAIQAFHEETGLVLDVVQKQVKIAGQEVDAIIRTPHKGGKLAVEVKRWAQQANLGALAEQVKRLPMPGVLVADYINPNMAEKLIAMGIQFIDAVGNAYINQPPLYIHVIGKKQRNTLAITKKEINRAFDATGLKVVFGFLCDPQLVQAAYREIAERTDVALGTVGWILNGLKDAGFIADRGQGKKGRRLINQRKMLDRWVEAYPERLKPKLRIGVFIANDPLWWKEIEIDKYGAYWGGEIAAAKYTNYLQPQTITIYATEDAANKVLTKARLRKYTGHEAGNWRTEQPGITEIYRPFWPGEPNEKGGLVHPILVYADLIATGDSRNLETARMIYERFIAKHIGEA